jgi:hypothetical protein
MQHLFGSNFGPSLGLGRRVPIKGLGFTPTGAPTPTECTPLGVRMIEDQGGYTPIGCPVGPDCYDIIDAVTGQVVIAKVKGSMTWVDLCSQFGYSQGGESPPVGENEPEGQCIELDPYGSGGCRDVVPCPKGPSVSNNPDGAAGPGQGRRYTLVDYKTGELIKDDVGDEIWDQYSVTSLPDAWACDDSRCAPYCARAVRRGERKPEPVPEPAPAQAPLPAPPPEAPPAGPPRVIVIMPPPAATPSPCDAGAWLRQRPVTLGRVPLRRGIF